VGLGFKEEFTIVPPLELGQGDVYWIPFGKSKSLNAL